LSSSELAVLDVGQGDCIVVYDADAASAVVIDCPGHALEGPLRYLEQRAVERLRGVIVTHLHDDHYGGIPNLLERWKTEAFFTSLHGDLKTPRAKALSYVRETRQLTGHLDVSAIGQVRDGVSIGFGDVQLDIIAPNDLEQIGAVAKRNENHSSAIVKARIGDFTAIFGGDATAWRWDSLASRTDSLRADVLVIPHHGGSFRHPDLDLVDLLAAVQPRVIITSVGSRNLYGHPNRRVLGILGRYARENHARLVCTQLNELCRSQAERAGKGPAGNPCAGDVFVHTRRGTITVETSTVDHRAFVTALSQPRCAPISPAAP
jgi:competence protein ComEC